MGELLAIDPDLYFLLLTVFETGDGFNKERGRFFYRDVAGHLKGPFKSKINASMHLMNTCPTSGAYLWAPFEHDKMWWFKRLVTDGQVLIEGPYEQEIQAAFYATSLQYENQDHDYPYTA
jgi:hypothetical protein